MCIILPYITVTDIIKSGKAELLDEECMTKIATALSMFDTCLHQLLDGNINVGNLHLLVEHRESFLNMYAIIFSTSKDTIVPQSGDKSQGQTEVLTQILDCRQKELTNFQSVKELLTTFVTMCSQISPSK